MTDAYTSDAALRATVLEILAPRRGELYKLTTKRLVDKVAHALEIPLGTPAARANLNRQIRDAIKQLRESDPMGARICATLSNGGGYYIGTDAECEANILVDLARLKSLSHTIRKRRSLLWPVPPEQLRLPIELEATWN